MAKELPFFKFNPTEWLVGKISYQSLEIQGAFMQCCAIFWKNSGVVKLDQIDWKIGKHNLEALVNFDFVSIDDDGFLKIEFLEEQLVSFQGIRQKRAELGALGGVAKATKNLAKATENVPIAYQNVADIRLKTKDIDLKTILNNSLLSEIKISDCKGFFIVQENNIQITKNELEHFTTARSFQELFIKNLKEKSSPFSQQQNAKFKNYVNPIRIMIEKEEATIQQLREAYKYLDSQEGDFWKSNILGTDSLRKQLPKLLAKKNTSPIKNYVHGNTPVDKPVAGRQTGNTLINNTKDW